MISLPSVFPSSSPYLTVEELSRSLQALVRINSCNPDHGGPEGGEARVIDWLERFSTDLGLRTDRWDALPGRPNLSVRLEGQNSGGALLFATHVDTVSIAEMSVDPFGGEIRDGRLWGRGSTDAKAQVVSFIHALASIASEETKPPGDVEIVFTVDEESGFGGVNGLVRRIEERGERPAGAVIGEPTELTTIIAHKGVQRWWIEVEGRSAHSAKPHLGINAIAHASALVARIEGEYAGELARRSHPLLGSPTINVSKIEGGTQVNLVPGSARILLDRRTLPGETRDSVQAEFEEIFHRVRREIPNFNARQIDPILVDPFLETAAEENLVGAACDLSSKYGRSAQPLGVDFATDGSKLSEIGIPTIVVGPGSIDQAHTADEFIELDELRAGACFHRDLMLTGLGA